MDGHSRPVAIPGMGVALLHSIHYTDANDAEMLINRIFLLEIEAMFGPQTGWAIADTSATLLDFILEARNLERLADRGTIFIVPDLNFTIAELLVHILLQLLADSFV
jgi:hypothetical protein